jgi:hypothetical protein
MWMLNLPQENSSSGNLENLRSLEESTRGPRSLLVRDAGLYSYVTGLLGAAAFMAFAIGPGWLGFIAGFLPASLVASWAVSAHA